MKNLSVFIFLSLFSFTAFAQEELVESEKPEAVAQEAKPSESKAAPQKPEAVAQEAKPVEDKAASQEPAAPETVVQETKPAEDKTVPQEPMAPEAVAQETGSVDTTISVQMGAQYDCDGGRSYTLHEPGVTSESHLCELDAGHTETPADWYALHDASFCKQKLQDMLSLHNCSIKN